MFKPHTVLAIGLWLIAIDFLRVPVSWRGKLYVLTGLILVIVYLKHLGKEVILKLAERNGNADTYTENGPNVPTQEKPKG